MFNFQNLVVMASQAMMKKMLASDEMYKQWQAFSKKLGLPQTSRAEFDSLVNSFNNTDPQAKLNQLGSINPEQLQKFLYYVLNMERSDYYKADEAPQYYVERALDFLNDKDAPEGKAKRYYVAMHCMD